MSVHLIFPERILEEATELASSSMLSNITQEALELLDSEQHEKAIPFCLAAFGMAKTPDSLERLADCCYWTAFEQSKALTVTSDCETYINAAITASGYLIDEGNASCDTFAKRGMMYFIKAQLDRDRSLLDKAEADYTKALTLGSPKAAEISQEMRNIANLRQVIQTQAIHCYKCGATALGQTYQFYYGQKLPEDYTGMGPIQCTGPS